MAEKVPKIQKTSCPARSGCCENNILFSDEKIFTVEKSHNSQNDRILAPSSKSISEEEKFVDWVQKPKYLMVWAGVSANCRTNLILSPRE